MNIQSVINSGRPFKRSRHGQYFDPVSEQFMAENYIAFSRQDVVAIDWEIQEERRELSWTDLRNAILYHIPFAVSTNASIDLDRLKSQLGFKE